MSSDKHIYPSPGSYAVAQIDLEATLSGINDKDIRNTAFKIQTTKCLVLLKTVQPVPLARSSTFCFDAWLVGPGLRPEEPDKGVTSDMCIPIFPAVYHPTGRVPFRPEPAFPFNNCYHWGGYDLWLDLNITNGEFTHEKGEFVHLSNREAVTMMTVLGNDTAHIVNTIAKRQREAAGEGEPQPGISSTSAPLCPSEALNDDTSPISVRTPVAFSADDGSSFYSERSMSLYGSDWSEDEEDDLDYFSLEDERACQPVVQIWLDLAAQLKEDEIPNPLDFVEQHKALYALLRKHREAEKARLRAEKARATQQATEQHLPPGHTSRSLWKSLQALPGRVSDLVRSLSCTSSRGHGIDQ